MTEGEKHFLKTGATVATIVVLSLIGSCTFEEERDGFRQAEKEARIEKMVQVGANPIRARCSLFGTRSIICFEALRLTNKQGGGLTP